MVEAIVESCVSNEIHISAASIVNFKLNLPDAGRQRVDRLGDRQVLSYTKPVIDDLAPPKDVTAAVAAIEGMSVIEMVGTLLATVANVFERRLGGPGLFRRLLSILAAFVTVVTTMTVRRRATILDHVPATVSRALRHLRCPPSRWAGA